MNRFTQSAPTAPAIVTIIISLAAFAAALFALRSCDDDSGFMGRPGDAYTMPSRHQGFLGRYLAPVR